MHTVINTAFSFSQKELKDQFTSFNLVFTHTAESCCKSSTLSLVLQVNEAFAPQYLAVEKVLGLDPEKTNVNGGAIAIGHPLGASGSRITAHLVHELRYAHTQQLLRVGAVLVDSCLQAL